MFLDLKLVQDFNIDYKVTELLLIKCHDNNCLVGREKQHCLSLIPPEYGGKKTPKTTKKNVLKAAIFYIFLAVYSSLNLIVDFNDPIWKSFLGCFFWLFGVMTSDDDVQLQECHWRPPGVSDITVSMLLPGNPD